MASPPSTKTDRHSYGAFGLRIASDLELPELPSIEGDASTPPDIEIRLAPVDPTLTGGREIEPGVWAKPGALLIDYPEARYLIRDGARITVQPAPGVLERDVRIYLLGSAMGALFHQRQLLPLHANAIEIDGRAVAFAGASGAGKSTLAAYFHQRGHRVLCDDVCVISFDQAGRPLAWPGIPRIKLWGDTLRALGHDSSGLERVWGDMDKFSLPTPEAMARGPLDLAAIYVLTGISDAGGDGIARLSGADAADAIIGNVYRWEFATALGAAKTQFVTALTLLKSVSVYAVHRTGGLEVLGARVVELQRHIGT